MSTDTVAKDPQEALQDDEAGARTDKEIAEVGAEAAAQTDGGGAGPEVRLARTDLEAREEADQGAQEGGAHEPGVHRGTDLEAAAAREGRDRPTPDHAPDHPNTVSALARSQAGLLAHLNQAYSWTN